MTLSIKKISICGLIAVFLLSVMLCCCFTNTVEAKNTETSCHQTTPDTKSSKTAKECDCDRPLIIAQKTTLMKTSPPPIAALLIHQPLSGYTRLVLRVDPSHAPPLIHDISPLYIKHSILRI